MMDGQRRSSQRKTFQLALSVPSTSAPGGASQIQGLARTNTRSLVSPACKRHAKGSGIVVAYWWLSAGGGGGGAVDKEIQSGSPLTPGALCKQCGRDARDSPNHSLNRARCRRHRQTVTNTRLDTAAVYPPPPPRPPHPPPTLQHPQTLTAARRHMEKQASRQFAHRCAALPMVDVLSSDLLLDLHK